MGEKGCLNASSISERTCKLTSALEPQTVSGKTLKTFGTALNCQRFDWDCACAASCCRPPLFIPGRCCFFRDDLHGCMRHASEVEVTLFGCVFSQRMKLGCPKFIFGVFFDSFFIWSCFFWRWHCTLILLLISGVEKKNLNVACAGSWRFCLSIRILPLGPKFPRNCSWKLVFKISPHSCPEIFKIFPRNLPTNSLKSSPKFPPILPRNFCCQFKGRISQNLCWPEFVFRCLFWFYFQGTFPPIWKKSPHAAEIARVYGLKFRGTISGN